MVVEAKVALQRAIELAEFREVAPSERDAPMLVEDRALEALHEAVGEGVTRLGPSVLDRVSPTGLVEVALELAAAVREEPASSKWSITRSRNSAETAARGSPRKSMARP